MNRSRKAFAWALAAALGSATASSPLIDIQWTRQGSFEHESLLMPKAFVELCGKLTAGSAVAWRFDASGPVDFNIHYHQGKEVVYPERSAARSNGIGVLDAAVPQTYCWMWVNKGAEPVSMKAKLARRM